jgi:hypothetical protein
VLAVVSAIVLGPAAAGADDHPDLAIQVAPAQPHAGQPVTLTVALPKRDDGDDGDEDHHDDGDGGNDDSQPAWDLDGDGKYDDGTGATVQTTFATPGEHEVRVREGDAKGSQEVQVAAAPAPSNTGQGAAATEQVLKPFPIVRIRGWVLRRGSRVRLLSVRAQPGSVVRVRCHGRGCPVSRARARVRSAGRPVRIHAFERHLRAGTLLQVVVTKAHEIGKYTRFLIRAGAPPARRDSCAGPISHLPLPCPA